MWWMHLKLGYCTQRVVCWHGGGGSLERTGAILAQQAQRAVEQVAHRVGQERVHDVPEALLAEVAVLQSASISWVLQDTTLPA